MNKAIALVFVTALASLSWKFIFGRPEPPVLLTRSTAAWVERHAPREFVVGVSPPVRRQVEEMILGPGHRSHSVLWLQALGASHVVSPDDGKFASVLEAEYEGPDGFRVYRTPLRRAARAVLVSRYQYRSLPPITSLYDRGALAAYVEWANRPEAVGFRWTSAREAEIQADVGPDDMILVRYSAGPGWVASVEAKADPIGFLLLDPGRAGPVRISLKAPASLSDSARPLPTHPVPFISPGGIVDGVRHTAPPFRRGTVITIYGEDLAGSTRVLVGGRTAEVLYAVAGQVNARLPADLPAGPADVAVELGKWRSNAAPVEIVP